MISMRFLPLLVVFLFAFCVLQGFKQRAYREGKSYSSFQNLFRLIFAHTKSYSLNVRKTYSLIMKRVLMF